MALGPRDTTSLVMLTGWDAAELKKYELQDGTTFDTVVGDMNAALGALNAELYNDPLYSSLVSYTDELELEYRVGVSNGFEGFTEYGRADAKRADTTGHMLPLRAFDRALGWTWDYLRKARMSQIEADIADAIKDARDLFRKRIFTRLLQRGDDTGAVNGLGSGYSPGFATTFSSTNVPFVPPAYGGNAFTNSHEHYVAVSGGVFSNSVFIDARDELREHGHEPPFEFIAGKADEATIAGLTDFTPIGEWMVRYGSQTNLANLSNTQDMNGNYYIGVIHGFAVRIVTGWPQYYGFGWKSYGANSQRNPLRIRLQKGQSRPTVSAMPDPRSGRGGAYPLQWMMLFTEFGVGVADRTAGTARYVNSSSWADGTPT